MIYKDSFSRNISPGVIDLLNLKNYQIPSCRGLGITKIFGFIILIASITGCGAVHNSTILEINDVQFGLASWYGKELQGRTTSSGEKYDMNDYTAAHRSLPFGTLVKVTNIKNGRSAIVRINDRGPKKLERKIDLSYAAAEKIGMVNDGTARVRIDVLDEDEKKAFINISQEISIAGIIEPRKNEKLSKSINLDFSSKRYNKLPEISELIYNNFDNVTKAK